MGKTSRKAKTSLGDFKVIILKNPLINNQAVISIRNLTTTLAYPEIPTYSWTLTPILNWTWSCSSLLSLDAQISTLWLTLLHKSQYVTNSSNLNDCCWLQSYSLHKQWRSGRTWLQYPKAYKRRSFTQSIWVLGLCIRVWRLLKYALYMTRVVRKETLVNQVIVGQMSDLEILKS